MFLGETEELAGKSQVERGDSSVMEVGQGEHPDWGCRSGLPPDHPAFCGDRVGGHVSRRTALLSSPSLLFLGTSCPCPLRQARPSLTNAPGSVRSKQAPSVPPW